MSYCTNCIHHKVCGNEGVDDSAMIFCADKQTDGDLISKQAVIDIVEFECGERKKGLAKTIVKEIKQLSSVEETAEWIFYMADNDGNDGKEEKWCKCSKCGYKEFYLPPKRNICPNCGTKMKESGKNSIRFATKEEQESIDNFIKEISKPTGINFFEQIDNYNCEKCKYPLMNPLCGILGSIQKPCGRKNEESER